MRERKKGRTKKRHRNGKSNHLGVLIVLRSFKHRWFISITVINCALWLADCCRVLCCLWQRWSRGFSGSKQKARWITPSWPLTQGRMNWSSVPGKSHVCLSSCLVSVLLSSTTPTPGPAFVDQPFIAILITLFWCTVSGMINIFSSTEKLCYRKLWGVLSTQSGAYIFCSIQTCTCTTRHTPLNSLQVNTKRLSMLSTWDNRDAQEETTAQAVQGIH